MNSFVIHTLGCGSAKPSTRHNPSATIVEHRRTLYMVDCGEGAQQMMQRMRLPFSRLRHIFLTHLHGDHVLGLPGLVGTLGLSSVEGKLTIHTFRKGAEVLRPMLDFFAPDRRLEVEFNIIEPVDGEVLSTPSLSVRAVRLDHRVPAVGYIFEEKPGLRHLRRDMADFHGVPMWQFRQIKEGADFIRPDGTVISNAILTSDPDPALSYAHISDTAYMPQLADKLGHPDLLFHETTYLDEHLAEARQRAHSTARQAAMIARDSGAKRLLTGHYSSRYRDEQECVRQAREIFPATILGREGLSIPVADTRIDY